MKFILPGLFSFAAFGASAPRVIDGHFFLKSAEDPIFFPRRLGRFESKDEAHKGCRERIEGLLCRVSPVKLGQENRPRECLPGGDLHAGARALEKIYDVFPPVLQKVFCSLSVIYLEDDFLGTAYAGLSDNSDKPSAVLGVRSSLLLKPASEIISMSDWITWKEQLSFGGNKTVGPHREDLVRVDVNMNTGGASDFLYYVIAHEFGHVIDFANKVNDFDCGGLSEAGEPCYPAINSWSEFSWASMLKDYEPTPTDPWGLLGYTLVPRAQFEHRESLCFYACPEGAGEPRYMKALYDGLQKSNLITTYASTNPWDDFAESVAFYAGTRYTQMSYVVSLPSGESYDLSEKYKNSESMLSKRQWIESFFERKDLKYPGISQAQSR